MILSAPKSTPRYRFDDLTLDIGQHRLWRGEKEVPLSRLSFELLRVLVEAAPNLVTHDELAEKAWGPRRVVTQENLAKRVMLLRQALGDHADQSRYVEGVRGQGYRLIPEVQPTSGQTLAVGVSAAESMNLSRASGDDALVGTAGHGTTRKLSYFVIGVLLLVVAFIAIDDYRLRMATREVIAASSALPSNEQPFTFDVRAPEGSPFGMAPGRPYPTLSPGGEELAFTAPFESKMVVWIRRLGDLDTRPLAGTDDASYPFWSADGRFIAFGAEGRLKRIAAAGRGAPKELTVTDGGYFGGAWASDDTIIFAAGAGLYRIPSDGGDATLWTRIDESRGEISHRYPIMLPDGRRFVYLVLSTQEEREGIYLGSLDDRDLKARLVPGDVNAALGHGADGRLYLFFLGDTGALLAQAFDASHSKLTGDPIVVGPRPLEPGPTTRYASFAARGRVLVYRPRFAPPTSLLWIDRGGRRGDSVRARGPRYMYPALSRDGTKLIAVRDEDRTNTYGLWLFDLHRQVSEQFTAPGDGFMSAWAPDDKSVIVSSTGPGAWTLSRRPVAGGGDPETLFAESPPVIKRVRDVTDDFVVFQDNFDLWVLSLRGERRAKPLMRTPGAENHARVSPDGKWLAFSATEAGETHVYVTAFPTPAGRERISEVGGSDPQWSSDGRELYYVEAGETLMVVARALGRHVPSRDSGAAVPSVVRSSFPGICLRLCTGAGRSAVSGRRGH